MTSGRTMSVAFRVDASLDIGTGHVMRSLTLADTLAASGAECRFICREHPGHLIGHIRSKGYRVDALPAINEETCPTESPPQARWLGCRWETDAAATRAILSQDEPDWLVVDHYALDARWEQALQGSYKKLMVIDDLADRPHACDLLLDQNLGREARDYEALVPAHCRRLIGPRYALLRPEFAALREYSLQRRQRPALKRLLITMGGVDKPNATGKVLEALKTCPLPSDCQIIVVMGASAPWLEQVRSLAATMPWTTTVRVSISDMAQVMADSDLAIGAGGSTTWERCCLGLPGIIVEIAANQAGSVAAMQTAGAAIGTGPLEDPAFDECLVSGVEQACSMLEAISERAARICDGKGAPRLEAALLKKRVTVRKARYEDAEDVWRWRNDGAATAFYLDPNPTPLAYHLAWFETALASPTRDLLIVEVGDVPAAHVRLDRSLENTHEAEVSIYLNPEFRGRGLGAEILLTALHSQYATALTHFYAQIHVKNTASRRVFARVGFDPISINGNFLKLRLIKSGADSAATPDQERGLP